MKESVEALLEEYVRPLIEADGGRIELVEVEETKVVLSLSGACSGCPGKPYTLNHVIESALRRSLGPEVEIELR